MDYDNSKPVSAQELAVLARQRTPAALERLDEIIQNTSNTREILTAIKILFERAYGKVDKNPLPNIGETIEEMDSLPREKRIEALQEALDMEKAELMRELGRLG